MPSPDTYAHYLKLRRPDRDDLASLQPRPAKSAWLQLKAEILHEVRERLDPIWKDLGGGDILIYEYKRHEIKVERYYDGDVDQMEGIGKFFYAPNGNNDHRAGKFNFGGQSWVQLNEPPSIRQSWYEQLGRGLSYYAAVLSTLQTARWVKDYERGNFSYTNVLITCKALPDWIECLGTWEDSDNDELIREVCRVVRSFKQELDKLTSEPSIHHST